jgi:hypothetical protein
MGSTTHRVIAVTGADSHVSNAYQRATRIANEELEKLDGYPAVPAPWMLTRLHLLMNGQATFTLHSGGSKTGYAEETACTRLMNALSRYLECDMDHIEFVDVTYSKDRHLSSLTTQPFAKIETATYREKNDEETAFGQ